MQRVRGARQGLKHVATLDLVFRSQANGPPASQGQFRTTIVGSTANVSLVGGSFNTKQTREIIRRFGDFTVTYTRGPDELAAVPFNPADAAKDGSAALALVPGNQRITVTVSFTNGDDEIVVGSAVGTTIAPNLGAGNRDTALLLRLPSTQVEVDYDFLFWRPVLATPDLIHEYLPGDNVFPVLFGTPDASFASIQGVVAPTTPRFFPLDGRLKFSYPTTGDVISGEISGGEFTGLDTYGRFEVLPFLGGSQVYLNVIFGGRALADTGNEERIVVRAEGDDEVLASTPLFSWAGIVPGLPVWREGLVLFFDNPFTPAQGVRYEVILQFRRPGTVGWPSESFQGAFAPITVTPITVSQEGRAPLATAEHGMEPYVVSDLSLSPFGIDTEREWRRLRLYEILNLNAPRPVAEDVGLWLLREHALGYLPVGSEFHLGSDPDSLNTRQLYIHTEPPAQPKVLPFGSVTIFDVDGGPRFLEASDADRSVDTVSITLRARAGVYRLAHERLQTLIRHIAGAGEGIAAYEDQHPAAPAKYRVQSRDDTEGLETAILSHEYWGWYLVSGPVPIGQDEQGNHRVTATFTANRSIA